MVRPVIRVPFADDATTQPLPQPPAFGLVATKMSKAPSLLFDLDDAGDTLSPPDSRRDVAEETAVAAALKRALEPRTETEYMLALHVRIAREEASKRDGDGHYPEIGELADTFRRMGYPVKVRTALGGGWGGACLRNLRHTFLAVSSVPSTQSIGLDHHPLSDGTLLIDPRFKEQFEIAHTTPRYQHLLATVPVEVVAPPARIAEAVNILCAEMALAFNQCGVPLPPWRQVGAMITKWQPRKSEDVDLTARVLDARDPASVGGEGKRKNNPMKAGVTTTGPTTVAQKLAMLGVFPTPPPYEKPSPISEGFEEASNSDNEGKGPEIDARNEFQFMIGPSASWGSRGITDVSTQSTSPSSRGTSHGMDENAVTCHDGDDAISTKGDEGDEDDHGLLFSPQ